MKELSLHILDIAKNSVKAGAKNIGISIEDKNDVRTLTISDDGCGMSPEFVATVTDPFTTTRTTRKVGMGIPLLKLASEQAEGKFTIESSQGENHGTVVKATFRISHFDCVPVGDYASTMATLIQGSPDIDFTFSYVKDSGKLELSTKEMREVLGDVPLNTPEVLVWVMETLKESF